MARFWPKWRYNGRVMAREVFFHQCLWVTKFCAKFGRSRIPRTARAPNSFIILRCMWKEPAPLGFKNPLLIHTYVWHTFCKKNTVRKWCSITSKTLCGYIRLEMKKITIAHTEVAQLVAAGLWENGEKMRKWRGNGEIMRKWRKIHSLHSSFSFYFLRVMTQ